MSLRTFVVAALGIAWSAPVSAHWCSNIFTSPARLVVKPEKTTVELGDGPATLRVYLRNNFPYRLFGVQLRGEGGGHSVSVSPESQDVHAGQDVVFELTITPGDGTELNVSELNIQVRFRVNGWRDDSDCVVNQDPTQDLLASRSEWFNDDKPCNGDNQSAALSAATLADRYPDAKLPAGEPTFGRSGLQQLIQLFGHRFCFNANGDWRCGDKKCPADCAEGKPWNSTEQFAQDCMRAGVELAIRKQQLGDDLQAARDAAVNALTAGGSAEHRCLAAVVGGILWQGDSAKAFTAALDAGDLPEACKKAGLRALDGSNASSSCGGETYEAAACAAAEGVQDNEAPVKSILLAKGSDGDRGGYEGLYYSYMVYVVVGHQRAKTGNAAYFPSTDGVPVIPPNGDSSGDSGGGCATAPATAPSAPLLCVLVLLVDRRRRRLRRP